MDERLDFVRSVTDGRYVYLRNYFPHVSQGQHVSYQFETPTTRVWRRLFDEGKANEAQSIFWRVPKAPEELYDLQTDPDEVRNLAASAEHQDVLEASAAGSARAGSPRFATWAFCPRARFIRARKGSTPYDMARDAQKYPFERIVAAAELASSLESGADAKLARGDERRGQRRPLVGSAGLSDARRGRRGSGQSTAASPGSKTSRPMFGWSRRRRWPSTATPRS